MLEKVTDVSKWSEKMKEPMEGIYGKVLITEKTKFKPNKLGSSVFLL